MPRLVFICAILRGMRLEPAGNALLARLRALLVESRFAEDELRRLLGPHPGLGTRASREVDLRRLAGGSRLETLARLFALTLPVEAQAVERALAPVALQELVDAGLVAYDGAVARSLVRILPYEDLLIAADPEPLGAPPGDFVLGVNPSARTLARLTLRHRVGSALDLGTGSGLHALLAARHAQTVVGIDVNPRALDYARLNARLNGIGNVELLEGSWFEPVAARRFDLIVANPPFVVSPDPAFLFRDAGLVGDAVSRTLVEQVPAQLAAGGIAQIFCNWIHRVDEDWRSPLESWLDGLGVDALLLRYQTLEPLDYAVAWNRTLGDDPDAFAATLDRWLEYDEQLGIERLSAGMLVLRRLEARRHRVRAVEVPGWPTGGAGGQLARILAAWDAPLDDDALLGAILAPVHGLRLERRLAFGLQGWASTRARASVEATIGFSVPLDDAAAAVVAALDGRTNIARALAIAGTEAARALPTLRRLYDLGCLERYADRDVERKG
jgi:methylase of polypeptide subunit release factors